jgi:hypothetical protein
MDTPRAWLKWTLSTKLCSKGREDKEPEWGWGERRRRGKGREGTWTSARGEFLWPQLLALVKRGFGDSS